jgi:hypothetical protein
MTAPRLEDAVESAIDSVVDLIRDGTEDAYMREAAAKVAVRRLSWRLLLELDLSKHELADHLDVMAGCVRDDDDEAEDEAEAEPPQARDEDAAPRLLLLPPGGAQPDFLLSGAG